MSEPVYQLPIDMVDWDACYDPIHVLAGMGPYEGPGDVDVTSGSMVTLNSDGLTSLDDGSTYLPELEVNSNNNRNEHACHDCGYLKRSWRFNRYDLRKHARNTGHLSFGCRQGACNEAFITYEERDAHETTPHIVGHSRIQSNGPFHCIQCNETLRSKPELLQHAQEMQHRPYSCECGSLFSRIDVLNRHLKSFGTDLPEYPCRFCRRHRGENGFRRQDHLLQHMRNYHHHEIGDNPTAAAAANASKASTTTSRLKYIFLVCSQLGCPMYRGPEFQLLPRSAKEAGKPFATQSEYTKHMREEHEQCPFNCDIAGCARTGRRGYFREKDLIKHRNEQHPNASPYIAAVRETRLQCTEEGCQDLLNPSSMLQHMRNHEWQNHKQARRLFQLFDFPTMTYE